MNPEAAVMKAGGVPAKPASGAAPGSKVFRLLRHIVFRGSPRSPNIETRIKRKTVRSEEQAFARGAKQPELLAHSAQSEGGGPTGGIRGLWRNLTTKSTWARPEGQNNIIPLVHDEAERQDLDVEVILDRVCVPRSDFAFVRLVKRFGADGCLVVEGSTRVGDLTWCEGDVSMAQIGRQLGVLGLIAVSELDPDSASHFYVGSSAVADDYDGCMEGDSIFRGIARLSEVECNQANVELEMWQNERLLCRIAMTYKVISSWEEVLPET